jgi:lysophospholipase L1-like esterase
MPGAYLKAVVHGTSRVAVLIDGAANAGVSAAQLPVVDYSIDGAAFQSIRLSVSDAVYPLTLTQELDPARSHRIEVFFRSAPLGRRWSSTQPRLRLAGLRLDEGGRLELPLRRPHNAIAFGDSITEGVNVEGRGPFYTDLMLNNARVTWVPLVCSALQAEYGQLGTGGQGMVKPIEMPPLPKTWDRYDADTSRLSQGRLVPEPEYVFCLMGTNDNLALKKDPYAENAFRILDISAAYREWIQAVRAACPHAAIFCITPPVGLHTDEVSAAVKANRSNGDHNVYLIDTAPLRDLWVPTKVDAAARTFTYLTKGDPTQLSTDGIHPTIYGDAVLGAFIAAGVAARLPSRTGQ